jgi:hypothetical protein
LTQLAAGVVTGGRATVVAVVRVAVVGRCPPPPGGAEELSPQPLRSTLAMVAMMARRAIRAKFMAIPPDATVS